MLLIERAGHLPQLLHSRTLSKDQFQALSRTTFNMRDEEKLSTFVQSERARSNGFIRRICQLVIAIVAFCWLTLGLGSCPVPMRRFNYGNAGQLGVASSLENAFLEALDENLAGNWSEKYTSVPHLAGQGVELVNWTAAKYEEYGLSTSVETFDIYLNYPVENGLSLLEKGRNGTFVAYRASLEEDSLPEDPTTSGDDLIPAFHGYSATGNVTAGYVFVNYGTKEDFELLKSQKVDVTDKIAIARYGKIFRGLKVKFAQEAGCVGVLIYSDPGDDFYQEAKGDKPYPEGPARNPSSLQRGSVQFLSEMPGDPTTPGYPSQGDVERADPKGRIADIPSLPISHKEVLPILKKLNNHGLSGPKIGGDKWKGGLQGFEYWTGPSPDHSLNLYNNQSYDIRPIHNVYGNITGTNPSEGYILIGNHRDAWIKGGASDPNSGSAAMLEVIRAFHQLQLSGWKPRKTIMFASWDGEEYALLGSTEFGEKFADDLKANCLAYLNVDVAASGKKLDIQASPFLNRVLNESLHLVDYPFGGSLHEHFFEKRDKFGILGSGSDYTVFLEHLGIPSVDMGFGNGPNDPVYHYHSNYDSYHWMSTMADPGFKLHNTLARYLGLVALRLTERKVIPTEIAAYASEMEQYFQALVERVPNKWLSVAAGGCHRTISDIITSMENQFAAFVENAKVFDTRAEALQSKWDASKNLPFWKRFALNYRIKGLNYKLRYFERHFLHQKGLDGRSWFKHVVYAAGRDTGYQGFAFPGLKEALDDDDVYAFVRWLKIIRRKLKGLNDSYEE
ncbi:LAME_0F15544g1_1 [Lachancea meyersii CBS 8951]|uniref:LAME_0F15544g1_1 n=1 Tax=Lachancea meyersii CBS 8951 TaxID=1266667 RepID=A0A1G4JYJ5_9SACH|nr:LAME_0F15544g1_1 [Lachancea meyersii CBS 8951]